MPRTDNAEVVRHSNTIAAKKRETNKKFRKANPAVTKDSATKETEETIIARKTILKTVIPKKTKVVVPKSKEDVSCNWKKLSQQLTSGKPTKRKFTLLNKSVETKFTNISQLETSAASTDGADDVWFDDVDPLLLDAVSGKSGKLDSKLPQVVAVDCEMVGIGEDGKESALARVSIVNHHGECIYDKYVKPGEEVTDYRTQFSGIRPHDLLKALDLGTVCHEVSNILRGKILVGHGLKNDLQVLMIKHPKINIRDTSKYKFFRTVVSGGIPSLKKLAQKFLGIEIQSGEHSSVQDAQAAMRLYMMFRTQWEADLKLRKSERKCRVMARKFPTSASTAKK